MSAASVPPCGSFRTHPVPLLACGLAVVVFLYIIARATMVGLTHDEALTYSILQGNARWYGSSTNHWLNTFLVFCSTRVFGDSELALRLPNVLAFPLYAFFAFRLTCRGGASAVVQLLAFSLLLCNGFILEFFGFCRGYGLGFAGLVASLYYLERATKPPYPPGALALGLFSMLWMTCANLSFLLPCLGLYAVVWLRSGRGGFQVIAQKKRYVSHLLFGLAMVPLLLFAIHLVDTDDPYLGGQQGFFASTFLSLLNKSMPLQVLPWQSTVVVLALVVLLIGRVIEQGKAAFDFSVLVMLLTLVVTLGLHHFAEVKYPMGRTGLYWFILLVVFAASTAGQPVGQRLNWCRGAGVATVALLWALTFLGLTQWASLTRSGIWAFEVDTKRVLAMLNEVHRDDEGIQLGVDFFFHPSMEYYRETRDYTWLAPLTRAPLPGIDYDYYYKVNYVVPGVPIKHAVPFPDSQTFLLVPAD